MFKRLLQIFCKHTSQHQWKEYCQESDLVFHLITTMRCDRCEKVTSRVVTKHDVAAAMLREGNALIPVPDQDKLILFGMTKVPMSAFDDIPRS